MDITDLDLRLLKCFDALVAERHVSRAADRLGMTQPKMSQALAKLRDAFQDPLLVRTSAGMTPTPRALEIAGHVHGLLRGLESISTSATSFNPASLQRTFTLVTTDYAQVVLFPRLLARLAQEAPQVKLQIWSANTRKLPSWLESGQVDLGLGCLLEPHPTMRTRELYREHWVCIARKDHPVVKAGMTLEEFAGLERMAVIPGGSAYVGSVVEKALARARLPRKVQLSNPHYLVVPHIVAATDLVAFVPARLAHQFAKLLALRFFEAPIEVTEFGVALYWHERSQSDAANRWLRQIAYEVAQTV
jgi:DNA-binding transcriptional LysR family regulator